MIAFADNNYELLKSFCKGIENNAGIGENADHQHFLPFPTIFSKVRGLFGEKLNPKYYLLSMFHGSYQPIPTQHLLTPLGNKPFENIVGKGEIVRLDNFLPFSSNLKLSSANSFSLEGSKICRLVMG